MVTRTGSDIFAVAGQVARDEHGSVPESAGAQWRLIMDRLKAILAADGSRTFA